MANQRLRSILFVCALLLLFYLGLPSESPATLHQREQISGPVNSFRTHDATFAERATPAEQAAEAAENTEEKWQASVERGKNFMCLLNMKIEEADEMMKDKSQSSLTDHSDFKGSGWTSSVVSKRLSEVSAISADALKEMGYQPQAPVSYVTWNQNDDYSIAGEAESYPVCHLHLGQHVCRSQSLLLSCLANTRSKNS